MADNKTEVSEASKEESAVLEPSETSEITEVSETSEVSEVSEASEVSEVSEPEVSKEPVVYPTIYIEKDEYVIGERITVGYKNTDEKDWIGLYEPEGEPGGVNSLVWSYSVGSGSVTFNTSSLKAGIYGIFLCDNDGYNVLDSRFVTIKSDDDTDYGVTSATASLKKGNAQISVTPSAATDKYGNGITYRLYWSQNGKRLAGYEPLYRYTSKSADTFTLKLDDNLFMPSEADGIEITVSEGKSTSLFIKCGDELKLAESKLLYEFQVITDLHITSERQQHISHLRAALQDISTLSPDSVGIFTVGDNTNNGLDEQYELLMSIIDEYKNDLPDIYYALGNHDLMYGTDYNVQVNKFKKYTGMPSAYYSLTIEGSKYIILGSDTLKGEGTMGETELLWLEYELKSADPTKPIYVFVHQPLVETVSGSLYSTNPAIQYWYGFSESNAKLRSLLDKYDNLILFTGHTHWTFDSVQPILITADGASYINCSSVGYLWNDSDKSEGGSEGYFVYVYEDYILLRGREFVNDTWCASAQFVLPRSK